ncbi:MAG: cyclase family protein [Paracoccaceae bacterium]
MKATTIALGLAAALAATPAAPQDWVPSPYGADDRIGAANRITPETVTRAAGLVTEGRTYALGIPVDRSTPGFGARNLSVTILQPDQFGGVSFGENEMNYIDDVFMGWLGLGTQIDALGHLGIANTFYNGRKVGDFVKTTGVTELGIEGIPPLVGRGVLLDIAAHRGADRLPAGELITVEDLEAAAGAAGLAVESGDIVLLHTGWLSMIDEDPQAFAAGEPGIDAEGARWLAERGAVAVGADTWGLDAVPNPDGLVFPAHQELLAKKGVYILENVDTRELAADGATEFLFVLGQPRYRGAVQAIINPVAIR